jgi:hypothetical protein
LKNAIIELKIVIPPYPKKNKYKSTNEWIMIKLCGKEERRILIADPM